MTTVAIASVQPGTVTLRRAGFVSRLAADGVDFVVVQLLFALVLCGIALGRFLLTSEPFELPHPVIGVTTTAEYLLLVAYLAWGWATTGRTPGKALLGLRAVTDQSKRLTLVRATARAALCVFFPPVLLWSLVSRRNAGVHDLLLSTTVVYDWRPRAS